MKGAGYRMVLESESFRFGERKIVRILVENTKGKDCRISSANWELLCGDDVESSGECGIEVVDVSTSILSMLLQPQRSNFTYTLYVTYGIGDETYIYTCLVRVFREM